MDEPTPPEAKCCRVCGRTKPLTDFAPRKDAPDGRRNNCRACRVQKNPETTRKRRQQVRTCTDCGREIRGELRRCRACRNTERECVSCGEVFLGISRECRRCQRKDRQCTDCGRDFRGTNLQCITCQTIERQCADCGRTFRGHTRHCGSCSRGDRQCLSCGKTFRGHENYCSACSARVRQCVDCGKEFKGNKARCHACTVIERECAGCGRTFKGHQAVCVLCQSSEHPCAACGREFKGTAQKCYPCRWLDLPLDERVARAQQWHGTRRARKLDAKVCGPVSVATYAAIMASGPCSYCGSVATSVDHVRPLARGGIEHESNLTPACGRCNSSKSAKLLTEWLPDRVAHGVASCPKVAAEYVRQIQEQAVA